MATPINSQHATDEIKIFSASTLNDEQTNEHHSDKDMDIEDRLSPVIDESSSPTQSDSINNNPSDVYATPFMYPYFNPYLFTPTIHKNSYSTPINNSFGTVATVFPGMPYLPLYPPAAMTNQPGFSNFFNPISQSMPITSCHSSQQHVHTLVDTKRPKKPHIKKPLNAFMIYMKEQRATVIQECTLKESSAINKILGQKWKELSRSEQDRYYELAKEERQRHMEMYPTWSARDNYGIKKRPQIQKHRAPEPNNSPQMISIEPTNDCLSAKKCRARYGLERVDRWCKHCRRKKKCTRFLEDDSSDNQSPLNSPGVDQSDDEPTSDHILSRQIDSIEEEHDDSNEENQHKSYVSSSSIRNFHC